MAYVYRYTDLRDNKIKYVGIVWGKNRSLSQRLNEHLKLDDWCDNNYKIEYLKVANRAEAEALESHFIALYKSYEFYNNSKSDWGICSFITDMEDCWIEFDSKNLKNIPKKDKRILYVINGYSSRSIFDCVTVCEKNVYQYKPGFWKYFDKKVKDLFDEKKLDKVDDCGCGLCIIYTFERNKIQNYLNILKNKSELNLKKKMDELYKCEERFNECYEEYYKKYASYY